MLQKETYEAGNKFIGYVKMTATLPIWKRKVGKEWLKDAPLQALQQALEDLGSAYANFLTNFPRFKRKDSGFSFHYPVPKQIKLDQLNDHILLPKLGWLHNRISLNLAKINYRYLF